MFSASALCALAAVLLHQFPWLDTSVKSAVTASVADLSRDGTPRRAAPRAPVVQDRTPRLAQVPELASAPRRIHIPAIEVDAEVLPLGLEDDRALQVPGFEDAMKVGWYTLGARPGVPGPTVLVGHRDAPATARGRYRDAVFARLGRLVPGDLVETRAADGRLLQFRVTSVDTYKTTAFPTREVYGPVPDSQLRLITCGGALDRSGHWDSNVVVSAVQETRGQAARSFSPDSADGSVRGPGSPTAP
ncbi:sortase domain-bontaining protein [Streptomyces monticola]|uniref:Sortase domain-bontaining protein n=1 Tax=Streptomyces monticola TaxID=2666263 RepID=A0ABW2JVH2_9ACTN